MVAPNHVELLLHDEGLRQLVVRPRRSAVALLQRRRTPRFARALAARGEPKRISGRKLP